MLPSIPREAKSSSRKALQRLRTGQHSWSSPFPSAAAAVVCPLLGPLGAELSQELEKGFSWSLQQLWESQSSPWPFPCSSPFPKHVAVQCPCPLGATGCHLPWSGMEMDGDWHGDGHGHGAAWSQNRSDSLGCSARGDRTLLRALLLCYSSNTTEQGLMLKHEATFFRKGFSSWKHFFSMKVIQKYNPSGLFLPGDYFGEALWSWITEHPLVLGVLTTRTLMEHKLLWGFFCLTSLHFKITGKMLSSPLCDILSWKINWCSVPRVILVLLVRTFGIVYFVLI